MLLHGARSTFRANDETPVSSQTYAANGAVAMGAVHSVFAEWMAVFAISRRRASPPMGEFRPNSGPPPKRTDSRVVEKPHRVVGARADAYDAIRPSPNRDHAAQRILQSAKADSTASRATPEYQSK